MNTAATPFPPNALPSDLVSVVIPARNAATTIAALLRSLIPDLDLIKEILLVDDGSEDATAEVAREMAQRHNLPLIIHSVSFGTAGATRNFGAAQARGHFLFFIDSDDELVSGALSVLAAKLIETPSAGLAIGACVRQTANRQDKKKTPFGYTEDCEKNVIRYLANELWPIAMGSALIVTDQAHGIRFPETIALDEDTCYWAALLTQVRVVTSAEPVLFYKLDEARMSRRYTSSPRKTLLCIAHSFRMLSVYGVPEESLKQRIAWVALRMARQLIMDRRFSEADGMMRLVRRHPLLGGSWNVFRYNLRINVGGFFQSLGLNQPVLGQRTVECSSADQRTLIVTVDDASQPVSGADLRNYQNAVSAEKVGLVRVVSIRPLNTKEVDSVPGVEFVSVSVQGERSKSLSSRRSSVETRIARAALECLLKTIRDFRPDTVIVEGIPLAALLKHIRPLVKSLILDMHNIESDLSSQRRGITCWMDALRIRRLEKKSLKVVDRIWVCSEPDRERLLELHQPAAEVHVVPNGIPRVNTFPAGGPTDVREFQNDPVLLFIGHLGYWPNVVAAERLARIILPAVRETFPSASLILAGRYPNPAVQSLAALSGVEVSENPESLLPLYQRAHVAVVPLSEGGGTRIKILEAMAAGLPVVATGIAVEGLGLVEQEEVLVADSNEGLVRHIIDLSKNLEKRSRQIRCAEKTVRLQFNSDAVAFAVKRGLR